LGRGAERTVPSRRAMQSGAGHHAPLVVEQPRNRRTRDAFQVERRDADAVRRIRRAVQRQAVDARETVAEAPTELGEAVLNAVDAELAQMLGGGAESDDPERVQRAALVAVRGEVGLVLGLRLAAGTATDQRLDLDSRREIEDTRPGRTEQPLVPG